MDKSRKCRDQVDAEREVFLGMHASRDRHEQIKPVTVRLDLDLLAQIDALCDVYDIARQSLLERLIKFEVDIIIGDFSEEFMQEDFIPSYNHHMQSLLEGVK